MALEYSESSMFADEVKSNRLSISRCMYTKDLQEIKYGFPEGTVGAKTPFLECLIKASVVLTSIGVCSSLFHLCKQDIPESGFRYTRSSEPVIVLKAFEKKERNSDITVHSNHSWVLLETGRARRRSTNRARMNRPSGDQRGESMPDEPGTTDTHPFPRSKNAEVAVK